MEHKRIQAPMSEQKIFRIMLWITFPVSGVFLLKNLFGGNMGGALTVGITMAVFGGALILMHFLKVSASYRQLTVSIGLAFVVFIISINSGDYYSDDFPLFLAVIAMTALYFRPKYALAQVVICDILLALLYVIHPEKAESLGQFIMCTVIFTLAAILIYQTIKRGRVYIAISENRAREAEKLLSSLTQLGNELQNNFENSNDSIATLRRTRKQLDGNTTELREGSEEIRQGAQNVVDACENVKVKMHATQEQVEALTTGVHDVENALAANRQNIEEMSRQLLSVREATAQINRVFRLLEEHMQRISDVTGQLDSIASGTTMLALNASIEAARAGQNGAGFAVVATKVQELAVDSTKCSAQVAGVIDQMQIQVEKTVNQLADNDHTMETSLEKLNELRDSFGQLTDHFTSLYRNIEAQNNNVSEVESVFLQLRDEIDEVSRCTENNQSSVAAISEAILVYKAGVEKIVEDSGRVHALSSDMIRISTQE
ncbi:MAG: hypothetical protein IJC59_07790 [Lachnospiraceae bacterium]|nr:hypothetical protein [Lachnospiraceae bacterium]